MKTHLVCPHCNSTNRVATEHLAAALSCGSCHKPLFDKHPSNLSLIGLDAQIAKSEIPVVVDFWAPWCGPCRMMAPEYEKACALLEPFARLVKVDTEAHQDAGAKHNIRSIPTLAIFKGGQELARISGARPASDLVKWVQAHMGASTV
jgi:thioredoxin 2